MSNFKLNVMFAAVTAATLMSAGTPAMADSTFDLVQTLVTKGILTEEEALPLLKGRENDIQLADKKVKKAARLSISDAVDNATVYGDVRVRYEDRSGSGATGIAPNQQGVNETRQRARYKVTLGVKTESGDWYTDLALAMGAGGRSDNATFGKSATTSIDDKEALFVKRAMVGFKATDWLTLEAGRMNNPLYTSPMVWDPDLNFEGLAEKVTYKINDADLFFTAAQAQYQGDRKKFSTAGGDSTTTELFTFQGGAKYLFNDHASAKAALTYTTLSHNTSKTPFKPGLSNEGAGSAVVPGTVNAAGTAFVAAKPATTGYAIAAGGVNDLDTIEIPAEMNYMVNNNIGVRLFGDYAYNTSADDRAIHSGLASAANGSSNSDATSWLLGLAIGSAADLKSFESNKMVKGDWSARIWYQEVGVWSVDPNAVDSDFMDSRVNMKGTVLKAQYNFTDNVFANFAYGHGKRKNNTYGSAGATSDLALNLNDYDLYQLDLSYKF